MGGGRAAWIRHTLLLAALLWALTGCGGGEARTVGAMAWRTGRTQDECTVYLPEDGDWAPFLVLSDRYGGNALLLRRDLLPEPGRVSSYSAFYEDCELDRFLNDEYYARLSAIHSAVRPSEIVVTDADALGVSGEETKTVVRNVFLLSLTETGAEAPVNAGAEGRALSFFRKTENRTARAVDGTPGSWWTRTPNTYYVSCTYGIGADGTVGSGNAYEENGVRPALCVAPDTPVERRDGLADGRTVYVLAPAAETETA